MFREELKRTFKNKLVWITLIVLVSIFTILTSSIKYNSEYLEYKKSFSNPIISASDYYDNQSNYIDGFVDVHTKEVINLEQKINSSLYNEMERKILSKELTYHQQLLDTKLEIYDVFVTDKLLQNIWSAILIIGFAVLLTYYIFFQDIQSNMLRLYASTKFSLRKLFFVKLGVLFLMITSFAMMLFIISNIQINMFLDHRLPIHIIDTFKKYPFLISIRGANFIFFIGSILGTYLLMLILILFVIITKNYFYSLSFLGLSYIIQYIMNKLISVRSVSSFLKYFNLHYLVSGKVHSFSIANFLGFYLNYHSVIIIVSLISIILFSILFSVLYSKSLISKSNPKLMKIKYKSSSLFIHEVLQVLFNSKVLLFLIPFIIFNVIRFNSYTIVQSDWEKNFQSEQKKYLGYISDEDIEELNTLVNEAFETKTKLDYCLSLEVQCDEKTVDKYHSKTESLSYLLAIQEDIMSLDLKVNRHYIESKPYEILYGDGSTFNSMIQFSLLLFTVIAIELSTIIMDGFSEYSNLLSSTLNGFRRNKLLRKNIVFVISILLLIFMEILSLSKVSQYFASVNNNLKLSILLSKSYIINLTLFQYRALNIAIKVLMISSIINISYSISNMKQNKRKIIYVSSIIVFVVANLKVFNLLISTEILNFKILLISSIAVMLMINIFLFRKDYVDASIKD